MFPVITFKIKVLLVLKEQAISHWNKIKKVNALSAKTDTITVLCNL